MINDRVNCNEVRVYLLRGTYALQSDYVFCILLRFPMEKRFTLLSGWGDLLRVKWRVQKIIKI